MKNALILALCLGVAGLAIMVWRQSVELAAVAMAKAHDEAALRAKTRLDQAEREVERLRSLLAASPTPALTTAQMVDSPAAGSSSSGGDSVPVSPVDPIMRERMLVRIDHEFASLWRRLRLTPEQIQRYDKLLLEHRLSLMDFNRVAAEQGVGPANDPQGYAQALVEVQDAAQAELAEALGPAAYAQFQDYTQTLRQRGIVDGSLQPFLSQTSLPLTETQADRLVQILAEHPARGGGAISESALADAAVVLTPEQFQALRHFRQLEPVRQNLSRPAGQVQRELNSSP